MAKVTDVLPEISGEEMTYIQSLMMDWSDEKARNFANVYRTRRRDPQMILILAIVGFFGVAGIQRFITDQIGMGLLYFFTAGLCLIGTIIDLVNYQKLAFEYNQKKANEVAVIVN
ncbi:TM2 domain-containing protein [Oscillatoria amoena NRMC-F 0135]|nr:TM2 domain-containing protein [Oscillatoria amoena NRMC-F 0135]